MKLICIDQVVQPYTKKEDMNLTLAPISYLKGNNEKLDELGMGSLELVLRLAIIRPHRTKYGLDNDK